MTMSLSDAAVNAEANVFGGLLDGGSVEVRTDPRPADADTAESGTLLADIPLQNPAFGSSSSGVVTLNVPVSDTEADASGTATWARLKTSGGVAVVDVTVSASGGGAELIIDDVNVTLGDPVEIVSLTYTRPKS